MNRTTPYEQLMAAKLEQAAVPDMSDSIWAGIAAELGGPGSGGDGSTPGGEQDPGGDGSTPGGEQDPRGDGSGFGGEQDPGGDGSGFGGDGPDATGSGRNSGGAAQGPEEGGGDFGPGDDTGGKEFRMRRGWGWYGVMGAVAVIAILWWVYGHRGQVADNGVPGVKDSTAVNRAVVDSLSGRDVPAVKDVPGVRDSSAVKSVRTVKREAAVKEHLPASEINKVSVEPVKEDTLMSNQHRLDSLFRRTPAPLLIDTSSRVIRSQLPQVVPANTPQGGKKHRGVKGITEDDYRISAKKDSAGNQQHK